MRKNTLWMNTSNTSKVIDHLSLKAMVKLVCSLRTERDFQVMRKRKLLCYAMHGSCYIIIWVNVNEWMNQFNVHCE